MRGPRVHTRKISVVGLLLLRQRNRYSRIRVRTWIKKDLQRRRGPRPQRRRKTVRRCNGLLAWPWCHHFDRTNGVEKRRHQRKDRFDRYFRVLLQIAAAQFARGDRQSVTYMVLDRRVRAGGGANREEWVVEQQQTKHETNRAPGKTHSTISRLLGEVAHSLHFIIDAAGSDFDSSMRLLLNRHP